MKLLFCRYVSNQWYAGIIYSGCSELGYCEWRY